MSSTHAPTPSSPRRPAGSRIEPKLYEGVKQHGKREWPDAQAMKVAGYEAISATRLMTPQPPTSCCVAFLANLLLYEIRDQDANSQSERRRNQGS
jgi:hypothetical protein